MVHLGLRHNPAPRQGVSASAFPGETSASMCHGEPSSSAPSCTVCDLHDARACTNQVVCPCHLPWHCPISHIMAGRDFVQYAGDRLKEA